MPKLTTEQATTHTLTLTDTELDALRRAAKCALDSSAGSGLDSEYLRVWRAFEGLGKPPKRTPRRQARADSARARTNGP